MTLLTKHDREQLHVYQYHGGDSSPVYKYFLSPLAQFCVDNLTPKWIAPNLITFIGLMFSLLAGFNTAYFDPTLNRDDVRLPHLLTSICILVYQTLDNMDGKQARRTGSSSALGMLFDHGCDAINVGTLAMPIASAFGTGWTPGFFILFWCGFFPFYYQTWEEYYTGSMVLPPFNGPSEGLLMTSSVCFISFLFGSSIWSQGLFTLESIPMLSFVKDLIPSGFFTRMLCPFDLIVGFSMFLVIPTVFHHTRRVITKLLEKGTYIIPALLDLLVYWVFIINIFYWCTFSEIGFPKYPITSLVFISAAFVELNVRLIFAHICQHKSNSYLLYPAWLTSLVTLSSFSSLPNIEEIILISCCLYSVIRTSYLNYQLCVEFADALGIFVFKLGKKNRP